MSRGAIVLTPPHPLTLLLLALRARPPSSVGMHIKWTPKMEKELRRYYKIHRKERGVVGGYKQYSNGQRFSAVKAVMGLKEKFPQLKKNDGFHTRCVHRKVTHLGLNK